MSDQNEETMRELIGGEGLAGKRDRESGRRPHSSRDRRFITSVTAAKLQGALRADGLADFKRFREDIDAYVDPSPREWWDD